MDVSDEAIIEALRAELDKPTGDEMLAPRRVARLLRVNVTRVRPLLPRSVGGMPGADVVRSLASRMYCRIAKHNEKKNPVAAIRALEAWCKAVGANAPTETVNVNVTSTAKTPAQVRAAMVRHFPRELQHAEPEGGSEPSTSPSGTPIH